MLFGARREAAAIQVGVHGGSLKVAHSLLFVLSQGDAPGHAAPMVQDLGDVPDPVRLFRDAKHEVVILHPVEAAVHSPHFQGQASPDTKQMTHVHDLPE